MHESSSVLELTLMVIKNISGNFYSRFAEGDSAAEARGEDRTNKKQTHFLWFIKNRKDESQKREKNKMRF